MSIKKVIYQTRKKFNLNTVQRIFFISLVVLGFLTGLFVARIIIAFSDLKDIKSLEDYSAYSIPTQVYDIHGKLITEFYQQKRDIISYKDLPDSLIKAIIAIEDREFYTDNGFNFHSLIRGAIINPLMGKKARGASTITQQLAKMLFTTGERSVFRKIVELWYVFQIEKKYSKEEILELYFNKAYLGHGCYGVQAASQFFFNKNVRNLTIGETSLLAGLEQSPENYSPINHPYRAQMRHKEVLYSMVDMGFLTKNEADNVFDDFWENYSSEIRAKDITVQRGTYVDTFTEYVRGLLKEKYGEERLYSGGLQVYTTLDLDKQRIAISEIKSGLSNEQANYDAETLSTSKKYRENYQDIIDLMSLEFGIDSMRIGKAKIGERMNEVFKNYSDILYLYSFGFGLDSINAKIKNRYLASGTVQNKGDQVQAALVSINPKNGYIVSMVGGSQFNYENQLNRVMIGKRPMGSGFKPIYFTMAIDKKLITPATVYEDKPMVYEDAAGNLWSPRNYDGIFRGRLNIRRTLEFSENVVAVQVWDQVLRSIGFDNVASLICDYMGLDRTDARQRINPSLSYALGVGSFSPYEVARAYCSIANNGISVKPLAILRVKDRKGIVIDDFEQSRDLDPGSRKRVMSPGSAFLMQSMLNDVLYHGTGADAAINTGFNLTAGGKTGTTDYWKDAWFSGFTKNLTTVVWFGFDGKNRSLGKDRTGAAVAAPVWMRYMMKALKDSPEEPFVPSDDIVSAQVCLDDGLLATPQTLHAGTEYFLSGTVPSKNSTFSISANNADEDQDIKSVTNQLDLHDIEVGAEVETNGGKKSQKQEMGNPVRNNPDFNIDDKFNPKSGIQ